MKQHEDRRNEILDTAQSLFYREGYDATTIARLIDEVGVAKGTFYHYFSSKEQLLDELIERGYRELEPVLEEIAARTEGSAIERLNEVYSRSSQWKVENRDLIIETSRVLYRDENLRLRQKNDEKAAEVFAPILSRIITQGVEQGELDTPHPEEAGEMFFMLSRSMGDALVALFLDAVEDPRKTEALVHKLDVYEQAIERIIGAPTGSVRLADTDQIRRLIGADDGGAEETPVTGGAEAGQEEHR